MNIISRNQKLFLNKLAVSRLNENEMKILNCGASSFWFGLVSLASGAIPTGTGWLAGRLCLTNEVANFSENGLCASTVCGS
ncbi:MAG: class I lanthipeptide [Bacteroidales bacterium]|nr:class I lanthipeptide [Bacteroidales bacterium]